MVAMMITIVKKILMTMNDSMVCEADSASDTKESENEIENPKRIVRKKCFSHTITLEVLEV